MVFILHSVVTVLVWWAWLSFQQALRTDDQSLISATEKTALIVMTISLVLTFLIKVVIAMILYRIVENKTEIAISEANVRDESGYSEEDFDEATKLTREEEAFHCEDKRSSKDLTSTERNLVICC